MANTAAHGSEAEGQPAVKRGLRALHASSRYDGKDRSDVQHNDGDQRNMASRSGWFNGAQLGGEVAGDSRPTPVAEENWKGSRHSPERQIRARWRLAGGKEDINGAD